MAQATMTVRTDALVKARFTALCEEFGMSINTAMNIFMNAVVETRSIPFRIGKIQTDYAHQRAVAAFQDIRNAAEQNTEPEMTLEEINAEIATYRAERKAKRPKETI